MKAGVAFSFATAMVMVFSAFSTADCKMMSEAHDVGQSVSTSHQRVAKASLMPFQEISEVMCASKKLEEIGTEKAQLEKKLTKEMENLKKAKDERNKNYGMVAGLNFQPASNLSEVINIESKIKQLNKQMNELKKVEKAIYEKYGTDIQRVQFI